MSYNFSLAPLSLLIIYEIYPSNSVLNFLMKIAFVFSQSVIPHAQAERYTR